MNQVESGTTSRFKFLSASVKILFLSLFLFLTRVSLQFATLLRSHSASLSFRRSSSFQVTCFMSLTCSLFTRNKSQKPDITKQSFFAGYADMTTEQERPSRKENRVCFFYKSQFRVLNPSSALQFPHQITITLKICCRVCCAFSKTPSSSR